MEFVESHKTKCQTERVERVIDLGVCVCVCATLPSEESSNQNQHDADCQVIPEFGGPLRSLIAKSSCGGTKIGRRDSSSY